MAHGRAGQKSRRPQVIERLGVYVLDALGQARDCRAALVVLGGALGV